MLYGSAVGQNVVLEGRTVWLSAIGEVVIQGDIR